MYCLRVYVRNRIYEFDLENGTKFVFGSYKNCDFHVDEVSKLKGGANTIKLRKDCYKCGGKKIQYNDFYAIDLLDKIGVIVYQKNKDAVSIDISNFDKIMIGTDEDNDIVVPCDFVDGKHCYLEKEGDKWNVIDEGSTNKTYVNGESVTKRRLGIDDIISIGLLEIKYDFQKLQLFYDGEIIVNVKNEKKYKTIENIDEPYPYGFKQSPRLRADVPSDKLEIQKAPNIGAKPNVSWVSVVLPPLFSVGIMFAISFFMMGSATTLLFSAPMALVGVVMSVSRYKDEKAKYKEKEKLRKEKYDDYINNEVKKIEILAETQRNILTNDNPSTLQCAYLPYEPKRTLWDRRWTDNDFMYIRLGSGVLNSNFTVVTSKETLELEKDEFKETPIKIAKDYETIENCPIVINFGDHPVCGIIGNREKAITLSKNIIIQTTAHHTYEDLRIVIVCDEKETSQYEFSRFIPHIYDDDKSKRYFANTKKTADTILNEINEELNKRLKADDNDEEEEIINRPFYLFVFASMELTSSHPIMRRVANASKKYGFGFLFLWDNLYNLPKDCYYVCDTQDINVVFEKDRAQRKTEFEIDKVNVGDYEMYARNIAPIMIERLKKKAGLPKQITFLQGYHVNKPSELNLKDNWELSHPEETMSVPIGVNENGEVFNFDIHEKAYGPHGLVAGMTGSGKSEMVQSWILSMCTKFSPKAVNFVLIDFKGTGLLLPFKNLPHLAGSISDLDTSIGRNLVALQHELDRRKALLDKNKVSNITQYLKLYNEGKVKEPLPYLFIVIDEFAEFKLKFPDFMQAVNSVFAIGRTLGVHILLLTQKPGSVIDDKMNANTRFRWCLKVANSQDSRDMLKHPDAAHITNPGRAYVQVGEDEIYSLVQTFYSGAHYNPNAKFKNEQNEEVSIVDIYGNRTTYSKDDLNGEKSDKSEIVTIVDYINEFAVENNYSRALQIWTTKLPTIVSLTSLIYDGFNGSNWINSNFDINPVIGLIDDPKTQSQYNLTIDFVKQGNTAIYGAPSTGKTTLLYTLITSLVTKYSPENVSIYGLDFGGGGLNIFNDFPQVGGIATASDDEKIKKLSTMLTDELNNRKKMMASKGLTSIDSYRKTTDEYLPNIVLVIDNFQPIIDMYPDMAEFLQTYSRDGNSCGMYMVATSSSTTGISYRIANNIKNIITLNLNDKSEYISLVGNLQGMTIDNNPGRGLIKGQPPVEIQIALPTDDRDELDRVNNLKEIATNMSNAWNGKVAKKIPIMPQIISMTDVTTDDIFVGYDANTIMPVTFDLKTKQFLTISSYSDTMNLQKLLIKQINNKISISKFISYGSLELLDENANQDIKVFDSQILELINELQERKNAISGGKLDENKYPYILVYIDEFKKCFEEMAQETANNLAKIVTLGKKLNIIIIINDNPMALSSISSDAFVSKMISNNCALLCGGTIQKHTEFSVDVPFSKSTENMQVSYAYIINNDKKGFAKLIEQE